MKKKIQVECKHEKQNFTKIMYKNRPCEAYNECRACKKRLAPDMWAAEGK